jgi:hypothetical protein
MATNTERSPPRFNSRFSELPPELRREVTKFLPNSAINPTIHRILGVDPVKERYEKIEKDAPTHFAKRLAYFAKEGFDYGIHRLLESSVPGRVRLLDEGLSPLPLLEIGKRGNAKMIQFLRTRGILNIDVAISGAILSHHNELVKELVTTLPVYNLDLLIQSTLDSDNLEILRFLAARMTRYYQAILRSNRTSYWLIQFYLNTPIEDVPVNSYAEYGTERMRSGFAIIDLGYDLLDYIEDSVADAFCSDLPEPLPFTYASLEEGLGLADLLGLLVSHVENLLTRRSRNFSRLEWLLTTADRKYRSDETSLAMNDTMWIEHLFKLSLLPEARPIFEFAKQYLGPFWKLLVDPIENEQQMNQIFTVVPDVHWFVVYFPVQSSVLSALFQRFLGSGVLVRNPREIRPQNRFFRTILVRSVVLMMEFVISQHPDHITNVWHLDIHPEIEQYADIPSHFPGFDFNATIRIFFNLFPIETLNLLLKYRLIDLWNELLPRFNPGENWENQYGSFLGSATTAGLNEISFQLKEALEKKTVQMSIHSSFPRLAMEMGKKSEVSPLAVQVENQGTIDLADRRTGFVEPFIQRRMQGELL